jgi:hypothetical protein
MQLQAARRGAPANTNGRKPAFYLVPARAEKPMAPKGQSFREILERELGTSTALNASSADAETTQVLSGYWA